MISTKIWETPLSWHVKCSLPVAVRVSKTRVLKLPNNCLVELRPFEDKSLCVFTTLKEYLTRTQSLRGSESQLFISYIRPFRRVSRETISRWVKLVLTDSGIDTLRFKPHSTRAASTSAASNASVSLDDILHTAGWSSESAFAKFYNKPIVKENTFADQVLSTVSSTTVQ